MLGFLARKLTPSGRVDRLRGLAATLFVILLPGCCSIAPCLSYVPLSGTPTGTAVAPTSPAGVVTLLTPTRWAAATATSPHTTATPATLPHTTATPATLPHTTATPATLPQPVPTSGDVSATRAFATALQQQNPFAQLGVDGQPAAGPPGEPVAAAVSPFVHLFPELRQSPAPDWLREGARATYYVQSASVAQAAGAEGSSGAGFVQYDLVALDANTAVSSDKFYLDLGNGAVVPSFVVPGFAVPGAGDYWLHPGPLQKAERVATKDLTVVHMPTEAAGRTYQAVRFEYHAEGAEYVWMFDQASGILLFYRHAIGTDASAHKQLANITLVSQRQLDLPWRARSAPDWITAGDTLRYEGTYSALAMGSPAGSFPYSVVAEVTRTHARWSEYVLTDYLAGRVNGTSRRVTGVAQISDALWLPREALPALRDGQVLDRDPTTGAEIAVSSGRDGSVTLTESGQAYRTALTYDGRDGSLLAIGQELNTGAATTIIELRRQ